MREFRVYGAFVSVEKFHTFALRIFGETSHIIMALQADQLMRGLQLDDASMQKLELDMREEKYESYRFEGDPNEVGHVVTTRCTTREDARDVR
mmetsp:Transcript_6719/g.20084  ORF Transcript_6719/g.20084 Transcript_6719/m.20084 type:complete len:93 (+) Transcript_6719:207-485(+)